MHNLSFVFDGNSFVIIFWSDATRWAGLSLWGVTLLRIMGATASLRERTSERGVLSRRRSLSQVARASLCTRHTERAIISSSSVRMTRAVTPLVSVERRGAFLANSNTAPKFVNLQRIGLGVANRTVKERASNVGKDVKVFIILVFAAFTLPKRLFRFDEFNAFYPLHHLIGEFWRMRIRPYVPKRARMVGQDFRFG
jgi:hypothetical protein